MAKTVTFEEKELHALESPIPLGATDTVEFSCVFSWASSVSSVSDVACYVNKQPKTSTLMPSGSHSISGNVVTLKPLVVSALSGIGGKRIVIKVKAVIGADTISKYILVTVRKDEVE